MSLLDLLFPKFCFECKREGRYMCFECLNKCVIANTICPVCGSFNFYGKTHERCVKKDSLDGLANLWLYRGVIRKTIINLKYKFVFDVAHELGETSAIEVLKFKFPQKSVLVPIPLHKSRLNWRGFNQTEVLGKEVAKRLNWEISTQLITKNMKTIPQVKVNKFKRRENVSEKFSVNKEVLRKIPKNSTIIFFDDVWTTGSTMKEVCRVLKESGAKKVWGLTICRS